MQNVWFYNICWGFYTIPHACMQDVRLALQLPKQVFPGNLLGALEELAIPLASANPYGIVCIKKCTSPLKEKELLCYLSYSEELTEADQLKESFVQSFDQSKESEDILEVKKGLIDWYEEVLASHCEPMKRTVMTLKEKQTEIFNGFVYGYTNGFVEGLNNKTKVIKRAAYGFRSFDHFRAKILLSHKYKNIGSHLG